jgi:hypothetical protein
MESPSSTTPAAAEGAVSAAATPRWTAVVWSRRPFVAAPLDLLLRHDDDSDKVAFVPSAHYVLLSLELLA